MSSFLRVFLASLAIGFFAAPAFAEMSAAEREEVEQVIREYLLENPELIEEAVTLLRERRAAEEAAAVASAIEENREQIQNSEHQMVLGNPAGAITLVEFFDYNCGYCRRATADMTALLQANPDLRLVMKEFPILSQSSMEAARVSVAVKEVAPERYLDFHLALFSRPGEATFDKALEVAGDLGLDVEAVRAAANGEQVTANLQEVQQIAGQLGISGTPSYIIGSELVPGAAGYDALQGLVTAMRECGAATC